MNYLFLFKHKKNFFFYQYNKKMNRSSKANSLNYRGLSNYYGMVDGMVGTYTGQDGVTVTIPVPSTTAMSQQMVPQYNVQHVGTSRSLMHGQDASQLGSGHFVVRNAYPQECTTFVMRDCDGEVMPRSS